ncbi:glycosyltransferase family 4 protein [Roseicyclus persicicus]|uniref:Glycosyltransferase family 4 protein n=1 Tax=Roseicyclus persicicus TaxID=2650661 RepID=A0A7X6GYU3_9RHOB|nr:glycosyltransferase family 4 protein [Roseibacterium persicicum]NKX44018.1 glycosyltransferase family 4 protein [Roseibacterium persicicum]
MTAPSAALAVPGDLMTLTGGYIYDRRLLCGLRALGREVAHVALGGSFPDPTPADMAAAAARLAEVPAGCPVIIDGLAMGAMDRAVLTGMAAPIVALVHHPLAHEGSLPADRRDHLYRTERDNLALAAHVLVPSPHTAALLVSDYGVPADRITIARPGTDRPMGRVDKADPPLILSVGIQVPRKGHDVLIRALAQLADRPWQAVIVGSALDAGHAALLSRLVAEAGLAGRVRLAGRVPGAELARLYGQAAVFALATRYEGYGIVFDEAMAHGLPIVTCATGAVPDTVAPGAGLMVPPDDPAAFAGALARVLDEDGTRAAMAAASAAAGAALPGWEDTARVVAGVLDRVAAGA